MTQGLRTSLRLLVIALGAILGMLSAVSDVQAKTPSRRDCCMSMETQPCCCCSPAPLKTSPQPVASARPSRSNCTCEFQSPADSQPGSKPSRDEGSSPRSERDRLGSPTLELSGDIALIFSLRQTLDRDRSAKLTPPLLQLRSTRLLL